MNRFLFGISALVTLIAGPALAADMPIKVSSPTSYDWTGLYVGGHVGWEHAVTQGSTNLPDFFGTMITGPTDQNMHGWLGGAQLGYNQQFRRAVLGVEVSGSWGNARNLSSGAISTNGGFPPPAPFACFQNVSILAPAVPQTASFSCNAKQDWTAQALTRAGYTFGDGRLLPYLSGGVGFTHLSFANTMTLTRSPPAAPFSDQNTWGANRELVGAVVGGGVQYAVGNGFSVGVEYLYANYGTKDFSSIGREVFPPVSTSFAAFENHDLTTQTIRIVGNYKFD